MVFKKLYNSFKDDILKRISDGLTENFKKLYKCDIQLEKKEGYAVELTKR